MCVYKRPLLAAIISCIGVRRLFRSIIFFCKMDSDEDYMNDSDDEDTNFSDGEEDYIGEQMGGSYELSREKGKLERSDFKYEVLSPEMISHKMFEIIDEVNTVFQVGNWKSISRLYTRWFLIAAHQHGAQVTDGL